MTIITRLKQLFRPASTHAVSQFDFLNPHDRFQRLLENERLRSDRTESPFALVTFRPNDQQERSVHFAEVLQSRLRATDHAGWVGSKKQTVGIILWNTDLEGAHRFVDALRDRCPADGFPQTEIHIYPNDKPYSDDDGSDSGHTETPVIRQHSLHAPLPQVKPLEVMFVKPLPLWKRAMDIVAASCGLIVLSPILLLTALLIKLTSRGPIFFWQQRDGLGGKPFMILKFRTMYIDAEARKEALRKHSEQDGPAFKMTNDPRITPLGRYLRKSCLDELPQLWNVLKGDMTLVGPRPLDSREARQIVGWGRRRIEVTPGLTCIWQVHGKSRVPFKEWMRMDIRYLSARNIFKDMKLIFETAVAVVLHRAST